MYLCLGMVPCQGMGFWDQYRGLHLLCVTNAVCMETTGPHPALTCSF